MEKPMEGNERRHRVRLPIGNVEAVRSNDEEVSLAAWESIRRACRRYLLKYNARQVSAYADDLVDDAIVDNLEAILSPEISPSKVSELLSQSLDKYRKRTMRELERRVPYELQTEPFDASNAEQLIVSEHLARVIQLVRRVSELALSSLSARDYGLIASTYNIEVPGGSFNTEDLSQIRPQVRRVALFRARRRFLDRLEGILKDAAAQGSRDTQEVAATALRLTGSGNLAYLYELGSELDELLGKQDSGSDRAEIKTEKKIPNTETSPPALAIVWDPEALTESDYLDLASALGDLVRAEGGVGIQLIDSQGFGIQVPVGVAT
jgi:hypothetical protein